MTTSQTPAEGAAKALGEPREFVIPRNDDRDLQFTGWVLSSKNDTVDAGQTVIRTDVTIYITKGGKIITTVRRLRGNKEQKAVSEKLTTGVHPSPFAAINWLKLDNGGVLGGLSKQAWVDACHAYPKLKNEEFERVE